MVSATRIALAMSRKFCYFRDIDWQNADSQTWGTAAEVVTGIRTTYFFLLCIGFFGLGGCTTGGREASLGVQKEHDGFVPARIAILPCITWPEGSRYKSRPLSNARNEIFASLCESFDKFVIEGFSGQPFMKGFSPAFVKKTLAAADKPDQLNAIPTLWAHDTKDCTDCTNIASFYRESIASRPPWQLWLDSTSSIVRHVDAVLIPAILYAWDRRYNDRGVLVLERSASAALLLISTANGDLIWTRSRSAIVPVRKLEANLNNQPPAPPEWNLVGGQIFTEHLWADFPGRQVY
jgi:hypothetical protein